jgi:hypothetical protein
MPVKRDAFSTKGNVARPRAFAGSSDEERSCKNRARAREVTLCRNQKRHSRPCRAAEDALSIVAPRRLEEPAPDTETPLKRIRLAPSRRRNVRRLGRALPMAGQRTAPPARRSRVDRYFHAWWWRQNGPGSHPQRRKPLAFLGIDAQHPRKRPRRALYRTNFRMRPTYDTRFLTAQVRIPIRDRATLLRRATRPNLGRLSE